MTSVRILRPRDIPFITELHQQSLQGSLSNLGPRLLQRFYEISLELPEMFTFVALSDNRIVGFVTGSERVRGLLRRLMSWDPIWFISFFLKYFITHPIQIIPAIQTLMYPGLSGDEPELLSLAVKEDHRGKGIGKKLFLACAEEFKRRGHQSFLISAYNRLPANGFYQKIGCQLIRSFPFHGERMNYYRYRISF